MRGDLRDAVCDGELGGFQSAPRTFMRGDLLALSQPAKHISFNPRPALSCGATQLAAITQQIEEVSIRAPHFHAGRHTWPDITHGVTLFQSAPRTFMRGDAARSR